MILQVGTGVNADALAFAALENAQSIKPLHRFISTAKPFVGCPAQVMGADVMSADALASLYADV